MPVYERTSYSDLLVEAEFLASQAITQAFNQDAGLMAIEVFVMGTRNGDVVPFLSAVVSRAQWQADPQIDRWADYHAAYALLQRHDGNQAGSASQPASRLSRSTDLTFAEVVEIDTAVDEGRLSGELAQRYLDQLD
ncbi:MAG: hypothetical protein HC881_02755 [Leptolyngbyaceae cyanobacterium SL_7_1]|nr:hypothetical protein [Leptolyngbyaceae cyanobacterium SL_7_1]